MKFFLLFLLTFSAQANDETCLVLAPEVNVKQLCEEGTRDNYHKNLVPELTEETTYGPYLKSMAPSESERYFGYLSQKGHMTEVVRLPKHIDLPWEVRVENFKKGLDEQFNTDASARFIKLFALKCENVECKESVREIYNVMNVGKISRSAISLIPAITDILSDKQIYPALELFYQKVTAKVDRVRAGQTQEVGDVFSDLQDSLKANGYPDEKLYDAAMKIMGIMSTRGAAAEGLYDIARIAKTTLGPEGARGIASLGVVASSMNFLDKFSPKGHPYSLPKQIVTECDYVRPYHFWMTAYLGHTFKGRFSKEALNRASQIMIRAYEKWGNVKTNSWEKMDTRYYNIETLKDITYHDIGMKFGLDPNNVPAGQLDDSLRGAFESMEKGRREKPSSLVDELKKLIQD